MPKFYGWGPAVGIIIALASGQPHAADLTRLVSFCTLTNCPDGENPYAGLYADANGNLLDTTAYGGAYDHGTVFEIPKTTSGYASSPIILVSFNGTDGNVPVAGLIADASGNLLGTTEGGGAYGSPYGYGTIFEIAKTHDGYSSTPTTQVSFNEADGAGPHAGLIADASGNLFGTTSYGGAYDYGTVFEIAKNHNGYASTATTLVNFNFTDGATPFGDLIADTEGNLFGTTIDGGAYGYMYLGTQYGYGTVFEIAKTVNGYASSPLTLVSFNQTDGATPEGGVIADANGNLFGTTSEGGLAYPYGTVFEIAKTHDGYSSTPTTLVGFDKTNGATAFGGLITDAKGDLFGTTINGGASNDGAVFEVTGSGFVPLPVFAGIPGEPNCYGQSVSALAQQYGGLNAVAAALGYSSVPVLQNAITEYCAG